MSLVGCTEIFFHQVNHTVFLKMIFFLVQYKRTVVFLTLKGPVGGGGGGDQPPYGFCPLLKKSLGIIFSLHPFTVLMGYQVQYLFFIFYFLIKKIVLQTLVEINFKYH